MRRRTSVAASSTFPRIPGWRSACRGDHGVRRHRELAFAGRPPCVTAWMTSAGRSVERRGRQLRRQVRDEPAVDYRAEDRDREHAAELAARVDASRRAIPERSGRHDREHRGRDGDEREAEAEADRARARRRARRARRAASAARRRRRCRRPRAGSRRPSASAGRAPPSSARRPGRPRPSRPPSPTNWSAIFQPENFATTWR